MMMAAMLRLFHRVSVFVNTRCVIVLTPAHRTAGVAAAKGTDTDADADADAAAAAAATAAAAAAVPFGSGRR